MFNYSLVKETKLNKYNFKLITLPGNKVYIF